MSTPEQRKNPRFLSNDGVFATVTIEDKMYEGVIQNFSSTGFAITVEDDLPPLSESTITVAFVAPPSNKTLAITSLVVNQGLLAEKVTRLGCLITDLGAEGNANDYLTFLTRLVTSQGLIRSMAKKPIKATSQESS